MSKSIPISELKRRGTSEPSELPTEVRDVLESLNTEMSNENFASNDAGGGPIAGGAHSVQSEASSGVALDFVHASMTDFKIIVFAFAIYIISTKMPVEKIVYQYVNLSNVPLSDLLIKAVISAVLMWMVFKFIL